MILSEIEIEKWGEEKECQKGPIFSIICDVNGKITISAHITFARVIFIGIKSKLVALLA